MCRLSVNCNSQATLPPRQPCSTARVTRFRGICTHLRSMKVVRQPFWIRQPAPGMGKPQMGLDQRIVPFAGVGASGHPEDAFDIVQRLSLAVGQFAGTGGDAVADQAHRGFEMLGAAELV